MKNKIIFLAVILLYALNTEAQISRQVRSTPLKAVTLAAGHKIPETLVYVIPYSEYPSNRYTGRIVHQSADSLLIRDFNSGFDWTLAKLSENRFSFVGPQEVSAVKQVYICQPQGPLTKPSAQNLRPRDYAAICLSDGHIIYAQINSPFYPKKATTAELAPGSGYLQFHELYGNGKFYQIDLSWDAASQQWLTDKDAYGTNPYLKKGASVVAVYSYADYTTEFFDHSKTN